MGVKILNATYSGMDNKIKPRCAILFDESIKSKYTKKNYTMQLKQFRMFAELASNEEILAMSQDKLQSILEDYVIYLRHAANPNSVPSRFQGIRHFCIMNRIHIDWDIIRRMYPQKQKTPTLRAYTSKEIRKMLNNTKNLRNIALIHFLASTGARIGVFDHMMTINHLRKMSYGCVAIRLYADEIEEYWSFLTPQATRALNKYHKHRQESGEVFHEDTPLFTTTGTTRKHLGWNGARSVAYRIVSTSVARHKQGGRYDVQVDHGFRKRFNTILKLDNRVNHNVAEKLMGHKNGLDGVYLTPTLEELFTEFTKVMHKIEI